MLNRKIKAVASLMLAFCLSLAMSVPAWAAEIGLATDDKLQEMDTELLVYGILNGDIQPVNEAGDELIISNIDDENAALNANSINNVQEDVCEIIAKNQIVDIRKIKDVSDAPNAETYVATVIFTNEYKFNSTNGTMSLGELEDQDVFCDVVMACSIQYDKIQIQELRPTKSCGYKIKSATGMYVSKSDPQMTCKSLQIYTCGIGCAYETGTSLATEGFEEKWGREISTPIMGQGYTTPVNQKYYYCNETVFADNAATLFYTVARLNSGYTGNSKFSVHLLEQ